MNFIGPMSPIFHYDYIGGGVVLARSRTVFAALGDLPAELPPRGAAIPRRDDFVIESFADRRCRRCCVMELLLGVLVC